MSKNWERIGPDTAYTDDVKVEAEGVVTHGPGTRVITITVFFDHIPTDENDEEINLDVFVDWLTDMTDQWVIENRVF